MEKLNPDIFAFTDFRAFLAAYYEGRKAKKDGFSHRFIAEKVGASSTGWFSDILKGRISLTGTHLLRLSKLLGLKGHEEDYFETLVRLSQAASLEERTHCMEKVLSFKQIKPELVGKDQFEYYSRWYYSAIRELLFIHDFQGDYSALARRLSPPISATQARKAVQLLLKLAFVAADDQGRLRPTTEVLAKDPQLKTLYWASFQKANLDLAIGALERYPKEERDISSLALVLSPEGFAIARREIRSLRKKLLALGANAPGDKVYQCNFQVFPVSK